MGGQSSTAYIQSCDQRSFQAGEEELVQTAGFGLGGTTHNPDGHGVLETDGRRYLCWVRRAATVRYRRQLVVAGPWSSSRTWTGNGAFKGGRGCTSTQGAWRRLPATGVVPLAAIVSHSLPKSHRHTAEDPPQSPFETWAVGGCGWCSCAGTSKIWQHGSNTAKGPRNNTTASMRLSCLPLCADGICDCPSVLCSTLAVAASAAAVSVFSGRPLRAAN
jgi:hypothetical protein